MAGVASDARGRAPTAHLWGWRVRPVGAQRALWKYALARLSHSSPTTTKDTTIPTTEPPEYHLSMTPKLMHATAIRSIITTVTTARLPGFRTHSPKAPIKVRVPRSR